MLENPFIYNIYIINFNIMWYPKNIEIENKRQIDYVDQDW